MSLMCKHCFYQFLRSNLANLSPAWAILLIAFYGITELTASSDVNILSKLETSRMFPESFGLNSGFNFLPNNSDLSISANHGWFKISSTPYKPSLFVGFLSNNADMKSLQS